MCGSFLEVAPLALVDGLAGAVHALHDGRHVAKDGRVHQSCNKERSGSQSY